MSLRTAVKSSHISRRMARWLSSFAEYNFGVEYKSGRMHVAADALSRQPDCVVKTTDTNTIDVVKTYTPSSSLIQYLSASFGKTHRKLPAYLRAHPYKYLWYDNGDHISVQNDHDLPLMIIN
ncbi:Reverse transcriptase [Phytophthora palmivora]|uniref:Reverse transcriptase n=1 Tax=Phytophthora palmivora TaxID=4796 RepID=A0A2P4YLA3_9STRA|nr:Reverse transcriptase [Phytophthora palmivora]